VTPPPLTAPPPAPHFSPYHASAVKMSPAASERKRAGGRKQSPEGSDADEKRGRKKGKAGGKASKEPTGGAGSESKRVYTCPHCQRAYDWNYNLNRHLKYECGKENAFQCAKCGRKFPHKQNCVYHLKRKHKVSLETIDQYMSAGLVIFRGSSDPTGHVEARTMAHETNC
jgi:hypothetical protein